MQTPEQTKTLRDVAGWFSDECSPRFMVGRHPYPIRDKDWRGLTLLLKLYRWDAGKVKALLVTAMHLRVGRVIPNGPYPLESFYTHVIALQEKHAEAVAVGNRALLDLPNPDDPALAMQREADLVIAGVAERLIRDAKRKRSAVFGQRLEKLTDAADPAEGFRPLTAAAKALAKEVAQQMAIDREELNILWWLFGEASTTRRKALVELPAAAAAVACGSELADLCMLPPSPNVEAFVSRGLTSVKKVGKEGPLEKAVGEWDETAYAQLSRDDNSRWLGERYPRLLPLTWLSKRLRESKKTPGWAAEFKRRTGVDASVPLDPVTLATQALRERLAQRFFTSINS